MHSKENDNTPYEDGKHLKTNGLISILVLLVIIAGVFAYNQHNNVKDAREKLDQRIASNKKIEQENKKIEKENEQLEKSVGVYDTLRSSKKFYDNFFNWNSWSGYLDNLKQLRLLYPDIDSGNVVDISGDKIGESASPDSSYTKEDFISSDEGRIGELVTQRKKYDDGTESEAIWYVISEYKNDRYDIKYMKPYRTVKQ